MQSLPRRILRKLRAKASVLRQGPRWILGRRLVRAGLVDQSWYERQTGRAFSNEQAAARDYLGRGRRLGLSIHPLVEPEWIAGPAWRGRVDPAALYVARQAKRGGPHPAFDDAVFLRDEGDRAAPAPHASPLTAYLRSHGVDDPLPVTPGTAPTSMRELRKRLEEASDQVTAQREVALAPRPVDWESLEAGLGERDPGLTSLVITVLDEWAAAMTMVDLALDRAPDGSIEVILVDRASRPASSRLFAGRYGADPRVRRLRLPRDGRTALAWNEGVALTRGAVIVLADARCLIRASGARRHEPWWVPLRDALADPSTAAVAPLILDRTGTVASAGLGSQGGAHRTPYPLFVDAPAESVGTQGPLRVAALGDDAIALRAGDIVRVHGVDPWYVSGLWGADLSLRAAAARAPADGPGHLLVIPDVRLVRHGQPLEPVAPADVRGFDERVGSLLPSDDEWGGAEVWSRAGLVVEGFERPADAGLPEPRVARVVSVVESGPAAGRPALRWAIKIGAPFHDQGDKWGDVHFAADLAAALERLGQVVAVDRLPAHDRSTAYLDDVVVNLRGLLTLTLRPEQVNVLWVISHPDLVTPEELGSYDLRFAASLTWSARMTAKSGVPVEPLLQATDPSRFHPELADPDTGPAALFVGNSRGVERPVVRDAIAAGVDLAVYGTRWKDFIDLSYVRGDYLPNETVGTAYRAAGVVLNDHWEDMAAEGFISNRIFDAVAAGGRVISDPVDGIADIFQGAALEYRTVEELAAWIGPERDKVFPDELRMQEISAAIRQDHSFDARAARLLDAVLAERQTP